MTVNRAYKRRKTKTARSPHGMVSSASAIASEAGARMLEKNGNAVDAAVATAFCLGVTEPQASGLGGQSMALFFLAESDKSIAIDGSSRAPFSVNPMNLPSKRIKGGLKASTVPSTPATLGYLLERYGRLELREVLAPSIEAAANGFKVTPLMHRLIKRERIELLKDPLASKRFFQDKKPLSTGDMLIQPELASCLHNLAEQGWEDFYNGLISHDIASDMQQRKGLVTPADLSQVPTPQERPVLKGRYRNLSLSTFPPPGAGRTLIQILNIMDEFDPEEIDPKNLSSNITLALIFLHALRERDQRPVDPDLFLQTEKKLMLDKNYAGKIANRIRKLRSVYKGKIPTVSSPSGETTHLCAADREGNMIGITQSIELVFGSKCLNPKQGFFYNNYMQAFNYKDMSHPYYLLPGALPWSSVAPTIIFRKHLPLLTLGSPGTARIATSLSQVISRLIDFKEQLSEALEAPRMHVSKGGKVQIEADRFDPALLKALSEANFTITKRAAYSFYLGCVQAIQAPTVNSPGFLGAADPRRDGAAKGPLKLEKSASGGLS